MKEAQPVANHGRSRYGSAGTFRADDPSSLARGVHEDGVEAQASTFATEHAPGPLSPLEAALGLHLTAYLPSDLVLAGNLAGREVDFDRFNAGLAGAGTAGEAHEEKSCLDSMHGGR